MLNEVKSCLDKNARRTSEVRGELSDARREVKRKRGEKRGVDLAGLNVKQTKVAELVRELSAKVEGVGGAVRVGREVAREGLAVVQQKILVESLSLLVHARLDGLVVLD